MAYRCHIVFVTVYRLTSRYVQNETVLISRHVMLASEKMRFVSEGWNILNLKLKSRYSSGLRQ
jgi:hypothetical protein